MKAAGDFTAAARNDLRIHKPHFTAEEWAKRTEEWREKEPSDLGEEAFASFPAREVVDEAVPFTFPHNGFPEFGEARRADWSRRRNPPYVDDKEAGYALCSPPP